MNRQRSILFTADESVEFDRSHKYSKTVHVSSGHFGKIRPFFASATGVGRSGKINFNLLTFGKANSELDCLFDVWQQCRKEIGVLRLIRWGTDSVDGDREMVFRHFPEIKLDVEPFRPSTAVTASIKASASKCTSWRGNSKWCVCRLTYSFK